MRRDNERLLSGFRVELENRVVIYLFLQVNDTIMLDFETGKIKDFIKFDIGQLCMATGGHNRGRVGTIVHKEKHKGSFDIVLVRDAAGQEFATRCCLETLRVLPNQRLES